MTLFRLLLQPQQSTTQPGSQFPFRSGAFYDTGGVLGGAPAGLRAMGVARGRDMDVANDYPAKGTWSQWQGVSTTFVGTEFQFGYSLCLSVPPIPNDGSTTLAQVAAGTFDANIDTRAHNLVNAGLDETIWRFWEPNVGSLWFAATGTDGARPGSVNDWNNAIGRIMTRVHAIAPKVRFAITPSRGYRTPTAGLACYPGDTYKDVGLYYWGIDGYDFWFNHQDVAFGGTTTPQQRWSNYLNDDANPSNREGLAQHYSFAQTHGLQFMFGEWALANPEWQSNGGGGDDPYFVDQIYAWMVANLGVEGIEMYFAQDFASPGPYHKLLTTTSADGTVTDTPVYPKPNAAARYVAQWPGTSSNPQPTGKIDIGVFNSTSVPTSQGGVGYTDGQDDSKNSSGVEQLPSHPETLQISGDATPAWKETKTKYLTSHVKWRRSFHSGLASSFTAVSGIFDHFSMNTSDWNGILAGTYDATLRSAAASIPAGFRFSFCHEWEDNIKSANGSGGQTWQNFAPVHQHVYSTMKGANPSILIGPIYMSYQWNTAYPDGTTDGHLLYPGDAFCDFLCTDTYQMDGPSGNPGAGGTLGSSTTVSITSNNGHMRWHNWAVAHGKPLGIGEWGVVQTHEVTTNGGATWTYTRSSSDAQIANYINNSFPWLAANGYSFVYWWNSYHADFDHNSPPSGTHWFRDMNLTATSRDYAKAAAEGLSPRTTPLALQAWNNMCNQYGT